MSEPACPLCGSEVTDLWDYDFGSRESIRTECPTCEADIIIGRRVTVDYTILADPDTQAPGVDTTGKDTGK